MSGCPMCGMSEERLERMVNERMAAKREVMEFERDLLRESILFCPNETADASIAAAARWYIKAAQQSSKYEYESDYLKGMAYSIVSKAHSVLTHIVSRSESKC